jgi:hypothetical protein
MTLMKNSKGSALYSKGNWRKQKATDKSSADTYPVR